MKSKLTIAVLIAALLSIGAWSVHSQTAKLKGVTYQYTVIYDPVDTIGTDEGLKKLDELGAHGWEIVGVSKAENSAPRLYLKRTIR